MKPSIEKPIAGIVEQTNAEMPECLAQFCKGIKAELETAVSIGIEAKIRAWNVARKCFEYGNNAEIKILVELYNQKNQKEKKGGASMKPHRFLMNKLVENGWISKRTSFNWITGWLEAAEEAALKPDCTEKEFSATVAQNFVLMLECKEKEGEGDGNAEDVSPQEKALKVVKRLEAACQFKDKSGMVSYSIPAINAVLKGIAPLIERANYSLVKQKKGPELE